MFKRERGNFMTEGRRRPTANRPTDLLFFSACSNCSAGSGGKTKERREESSGEGLGFAVDDADATQREDD